MADTAYMLVIAQDYGTEQRFSFARLADADLQLTAIAPKIGKDRFSNNPEYEQHTIISDEGIAVLSMTRVMSARVMDVAVFDRNMEYVRNREIETARASAMEPNNHGV